MMNTKTFVLCLAIFFWLSIGATVAQQDVPTVIDFDGATDSRGLNDTFQSIYSGPVKFTHLKHVQDYGAVCGDCHHDSDAEPINSYDPDATYACGECHDEEGLVRGPIAESAASDSDLITHRPNALHIKCIGCHKWYNDLNRVVQVPEACIACHARHPQDWVVR